MQFDPATSEESPVAPVREGLPKAFRMRHGRHYVEQLMGDAPLRTVREIAVSDFHAVPESDEDVSTLQQSIGSVGVLQPLLVTFDAGRYHVIAGRNRLRAAMALGLPTVPCLVHDVARENLESLRQAAGRRAIAPRDAETAVSQPDAQALGPERSALELLRSSLEPVQEDAPSTAPTAREISGRIVASPPTIAVAADDKLRLAVLADLMHVELQRGETLGAVAEALERPAPATRETVVAGTFVEPLLSRIRPEARLRNAKVEVSVPDFGYRIQADKRLLSLALECMAHGMLMLCGGDSSHLRIAVEGTWIRPALIVDISQDATTVDVNTARRFFDRDFCGHPMGHAGALMAACVARVAREHGGRAGIRALTPRGCMLTLVIPRPMQG